MNDEVETGQGKSGLSLKSIRLWRHIVAITLLSAVLAAAPVYDGVSRGFLFVWPMLVVAIFAVSGVLSGLAWLFLTKHVQGNVLFLFVATAWSFCVLSLIGSWQSVLWDESSEKQNKSVRNPHEQDKPAEWGYMKEGNVSVWRKK